MPRPLTRDPLASIGRSLDWPLIAILLLATAVRFYRIGFESLWYDEAAMLVRIENGWWPLFTDWHSHRQGWLYPVLLKLWYGAFGSSGIALRIPSAMFGVACVAAIYVVGRKMFGRTAGRVAAVLMAISPFAILHSQDARPYTLFMLGALLSLHYFVRLMERYSRRDAVLYGAWTLVALFSHPMALPIVPAQVAAYFVYRRFPEHQGAQNTRLLIRTFIITAVLSLPQTGRTLAMFVLKTRGEDISAWIPAPTAAAFAETARHYFMYPLLAITALSVLALVALFCVKSDRAARPALLLLLSVVVFCVFLPWVTSLVVAPVYVIRYTIPAFAAVLLALGWALSKLDRLLRAATVIVLMILTFIPLYGFYTTVDRDPFRQTAEFIHGQFLPGDVIVAHPWWLQRVTSYYLDRYPGVVVLAPPDSATVGEWALTASRIWLIRSYEKPGEQIDGVIEAVSAGRKVEGDFNMLEHVRLNPWVLYNEPLRVIRYGPRKTVE